MRWFFCLLLPGCLLLTNACERQGPEVLEALPGAGHHGKNAHGEAHAEAAHADEHSVDTPATAETGHGETGAGSSQ